MTLAFGVFCLSAYSPLFATLLVWDTPLRTNNHYGDAFFRSGSYLILILTAALGFDALVRGRLMVRKLLLKLFVAVTAVSAVAMISFYDSAIKSEPNFGFFTVMAFVFFVLAYWLSEIKSRKVRERLVWALMACTLLDVSTVVNLNVRKIMERPFVRLIDETPAPDKLGMLNGDPGEYSQTILMYQEYYDLLAANIDANKWPMFRIFSAAHASQGLTADQKSFEDQNPQMDSLPMDAGALESEPFKKFAHDPNPTQSKASLQGRLVHLSFNDLEVNLKAEREAILFIRDAYSPYWTATVDGIKTPIARAMGNFKALMLPAGNSTLHLHFSPPWVAGAFGCAYLILFVMGAALCIWNRRFFKKSR